MSVTIPRGAPAYGPVPSYMQPGTDVLPPAGEARPQAAAATATRTIPGTPWGTLTTARFLPAATGPATITRITVSAEIRCPCYVFVGEPARVTLVSYTRRGELDENEPTRPIFVPESTPLVIAWAGTPTAATARIEWMS